MSDTPRVEPTAAERERWVAAVAAELGIDRAVLDAVTDPVLDMVRDVAHGVNRPSAPLTAFLVGLAGAHASDESGAATVERVEEQLARVNALVDAWVPDPRPELAPGA